MGWLWHRRLDHVGMKQLNILVKHDLVRGLKNVVFENDKLCGPYQAGKQVRNTHHKKSIMSTSVGVWTQEGPKPMSEFVMRAPYSGW
jgi:hypothetical protein